MAEREPAETEQQGSVAARPGSMSTRSKEITLLVIVVLLVLILAVIFITRGGKKGERGSIVREGNAAPSFSLPALDGRTVNLGDYRGRVVMVHFWATWCPPCVEEMPGLEELYQTFKGSGLEILAVSVDEGGPRLVQSFMERNHLSFPALLDPARSVSSRYGTYKFPETYVIDRQGIVRHKAIGSLDWTVAANQERLRAILEAR